MALPTDSRAQSLPAEERVPMPGSAQLGHAFAIQLWASTLILTVLVLIWALAGAGGFWPVWVLLPLALALAIHGWVQLLRRRPAIWRRSHMTFALALTGGIWLSLTLFNIGVWGASGGGSFWPEWPALAFAIAFAIQASAVVFAAPTQQQMSERIDVLTSTRAGAVDAQEEKLRRIERDLHDGAQARLVALGMSLGMAEQKLDAAEPGEARELLAEARSGAEHALRELRDLARGIHPPVLADRGLEAAVRSLADLSTMQVSLSVDLGDRPSAAVESAAYFICAEGLANAAKHAHATRVEIRIVRHGASLHIEIVDDGSGGADAEGSGLRGLRSRVEALDGTFRVLSPPGGPTVLSAELPCA